MPISITAGPAPDIAAALLDTDQVAALCGCSSRTIRRLADAGRMPRPIKLGGLLRFQRVVIDEWIAAGCPNCRTGK